jgi:hypothetical protein
MKIIQITTCVCGEKIEIHGLGDDGKLYLWGQKDLHDKEDNFAIPHWRQGWVEQEDDIEEFYKRNNIS